MAISEFATGTHTVQTTEWSMINNSSSIATSTSAGVYQAFIDLNALAASDLFEFRVYEKVLSSSTQRTVFVARFANAQGAPIWASPSLVLINGWDMSLKKISGTDESILWSIRKIA